MAEQVQEASDRDQNHTRENGVDEAIRETAIFGQRVHSRLFFGMLRRAPPHGVD